MTHPIRKKLIEVALPLEAINIASAREKSIRHGHPSTLHLWWARRPLAAARAVIFAQMVDDPSSWPDLFPDEKAQEKERQRLFKIIEELVKWENTTNEAVLQPARDEIWRSWRRACAENVDHPRAKELFDRDKLPAFHDPFAGGGALPLEAQRLGLESYASDLNPVAVLINKAMIEIPPKFANLPPVNPESRRNSGLATWKGAQGLADDVRYYGKWMRDEAEKRIGHLYPNAVVYQLRSTREFYSEDEYHDVLRQEATLIGDPTSLLPHSSDFTRRELTVIAWIWARTVKSPNPAFRDIDVPLASTFMLSTKPGKEAYVEPVIENGGYRFTVKIGKPKDGNADIGTSAGKRSAFTCLLSGTPITYDYIRGEGTNGRMGSRLMAVVAEGERGRIYLTPSRVHEDIAKQTKPQWTPEINLPNNTRDFKTPLYGLNTFADLFTARQLVALTTFSDLIAEARERAETDARAVGLSDDGIPLNDCGSGAKAYAESVATYLSLAIDRMANTLCTVARWTAERQQTVTAFARQAIPMTWDYPDVNPFANAAGGYGVSVDGVIKGMTLLTEPAGHAQLADASIQSISQNKVVSTDPPYYDNIGYADLSDFFYVWLRRSLRLIYPNLFKMIAVPKAEELVATPYRHGGKSNAEQFFLQGMTKAMQRLAEQSHPAFPVTIYYAFKQSETTASGGEVSTGWETFLQAVIHAGFSLTGTWPMRTELSNRMIGSGTNALASSIVLVCRKRELSAAAATRREFLTALERELAHAIGDLQRGNIAPVDLQQAAIGPGMAIFTRYSSVLDANGKPLSVRDALSMINQALDTALTKQEGAFDSDTRWALTWFEQFGFADGEYGAAETLSKAKNTSVQGIVDAGIAASGKGKVRLLRPEELPDNWNPSEDNRLTVWETVHHLIRLLDKGESSAADLFTKLGSKAEAARDLCYRLYSISGRTKRSQDAQRYNALVQSWPEIVAMAGQAPKPKEEPLFDFEGTNE